MLVVAAEIDGIVAADFPENSDVAGEDGESVLHRLNQGQSEPFATRREKQCRGVTIGMIELGVRRGFKPEEIPPELPMRANASSQVVRTPAEAAQDQQSGLDTRRPQAIEDIEDQCVILSWLDRPDHKIDRCAAEDRLHG